MDVPADSLAANRDHRDERAPAHTASANYAVDRFLGVPWNALPGQVTRRDDGEWRVTDRPERLPHSYPPQAVRP